MIPDQLILEVLKLYPDGLVLGSCRAIVGKFGLTIEWINADGTKGQRRYKEGDKISIVEIKGNNLELGDDCRGVTIHPGFFKGFEKQKP